MLTNEFMTITLVFLNVLFCAWMFVIGVYHYFLHQEHTLARQMRNDLENALNELMEAQKKAREEEAVAMLRCKLTCDNK